MLIVPITGKISWRHPPVVTIALIVLTCLIYFAFQNNEMELWYQAEDFYMTSGLADIEVPLYLAHIAEHRPDGAGGADLDRLDEEDIYRYHRDIEADVDFIEALRNGEVMAADDPAYETWRELRSTYEKTLERVVSVSYGFRPAYHRPVTFLTHMFLHGGVGHLIGNMIFLWILGVSLELGCGRVVFTAAYLLGGIMAVVFFWTIYPASTVPLVGASGAIAGLMGIFTVLYGRNRVNIFFSTGFYFNYVKVPAIMLLPLWVGNELYQLFWGGVSQVAYVAHIGGLLGGACLGVVNLKLLRRYDAEIFAEKTQDPTSGQIEKALGLIGELRFDEARSQLSEVLANDPDHLEAHKHLFNIEKHNPGSERFHQVAQKLLQLLCGDSAAKEAAYRTYVEYVKRVKSPRLPPQLYLQIGMICTAAGDLQKTQKILALLLKKKADLPGLPKALLKLAQTYRQKGLTDQCRKCVRVIEARYPDSAEAQIAKQAFLQ